MAAYVFSLLPLLHLTYRVSVPCHGRILISPMAWHRRILISATLTECLYWLIDTDKLSTTSRRKRLQAASNLPDTDLFSCRPPSWFVCSRHHLKARQQHTQPHAGSSGHSCCWITLLKYATVLSDLGCLAGAEQRGSAGSLVLALPQQTRLQSFISITAAQRQSERCEKSVMCSRAPCGTRVPYFCANPVLCRRLGLI